MRLYSLFKNWKMYNDCLDWWIYIILETKHEIFFLDKMLSLHACTRLGHWYKEKSRPTWWIMSVTLALHICSFWPIIVHIMMASLLYSNMIFVQIRAWGHKIPFVGFYNSHVLFFVFPYKCFCLQIQIKLQDITFTKKQKKNWHENTKTGPSKIMKH